MAISLPYPTLTFIQNGERITAGTDGVVVLSNNPPFISDAGVANRPLRQLLLNDLALRDQMVDLETNVNNSLANFADLEHNTLDGVQGGDISDRYHLTNAEHQRVSALNGVSGGYQVLGAGNRFSNTVVPVHNNLESLQGGGSGNYYHLSQSSFDFISSLLTATSGNPANLLTGLTIPVSMVFTGTGQFFFNVVSGAARAVPGTNSISIYREPGGEFFTSDDLALLTGNLMIDYFEDNANNTNFDVKISNPTISPDNQVITLTTIGAAAAGTTMKIFMVRFVQ